MSEEMNNTMEAPVENESVATEVSEVEAVETVDEYSGNDADTDIQNEEVEEKRISKRLLLAVVGGVLAVLVVFILLVFNPFNMQSVDKVQETLHIGGGEKYSEKYIDVTGRTVGEVASEMGMEFKEFRLYYNLPEDMPEDTHEYAAINCIPAKTYAEKEWGITFSEAKELMGWGDDVTEATTIGEAINKTTLSRYFGEEQVETMKVLYNLDEAVTGETLYGEVREDIEARMKAEREAAAAEAEVTEPENPEPVEATENTETEE